MNPLIAQIIESMATRDGTLQPAFTTTRSGRDGAEMVTGSGREERTHPAAGSRPQQSMGEHSVVLARSGAGPRTTPTDAEAYAAGGGLTHTTGEKGLGMAINPQAIQSIMQMMMQGQANGTGPGPVPAVPGPVSAQDVMATMGGAGGGGIGQIMQMLGVGGGGGGQPGPDMQEPGQHYDPAEPSDPEDKGQSTEDELDAVHGQINKGDPSQMAEELRQCLQDGDRKGCMKILQQMEEQGIDVSKLPPDIQKQLQRDGYLDGNDDGDGPDNESDPGDHEYR